MNEQANPVCPCCGGSMRQSEGLRGTNPNYYRETGWRCNTGYDCDLVGFLLYADYLADPAKIQRLAQSNQNNRFVQMVRSKRAKIAI